MAIKFFWRCEAADFSATNGTDDYSAGDDVGSPTGANIAINTTAVKVGTNGVYTKASELNLYRFTPTSIVNTTPSSLVCTVGFWMKHISAVDTGFRSVGFYLSVDASNYLMLKTASSGHIQFESRNASGSTSITTSGTGMSAGTWYWVELSIDTPNGDMLVRFYNASDLTTASASNSTATITYTPTGTFANLDLAYTNVGIANDIYFDHFIITDAYNDDLTQWANTALYSSTQTTKYLKLLAHSSAASATGVAGVVFDGTGYTTSDYLGTFSGKSFEASLESGNAVLKVPVADFGGTALTTSSTPVAFIWNSTDAGIGPADCTVIEE